MTASYKREGRAGGCGAGGWAIRLEAFLLSMFSRRMQALCQGFFVPKWVGVAYPRCGRSFRPIAFCLAEIEPFYWLLELLQYCDSLRDVKPCSTERGTLGYD